MNTIVESIIGEAVFAGLVALVITPAARHWKRTLLEPVAKRTEQLERNGGASLADAVYELRDAFYAHLEEAAEDRRELSQLRKRFYAHLQRLHASENGERRDG